MEEKTFKFSFEKGFDVGHVSLQVERHLAWVWLSGLAYVFLVFAGKRFMKDRQPLRTPQIRTTLIIWNLTLAIYSIMASCWTIPILWTSVTKEGFKGSACSGRYDYYLVGVKRSST